MASKLERVDNVVGIPETVTLMPMKGVYGYNNANSINSVTLSVNPLYFAVPMDIRMVL